MITCAHPDFLYKDETTGKGVYDLELKGLKTDTKPVGTWNDLIIENGSTFTEIDDSGYYMYDRENEEWKSKS
ncbi:MAG: hypothetical protein J5819_00325 [Eubacterium sp.]|nr:hypothetical protein [Eubacterium sp.]